ncbi:MAG: SRPBCC family protein [Planctomycetales bacterium]|nr:SRPBCC family protein [Planctomycetales bacterium]
MSELTLCPDDNRGGYLLEATCRIARPLDEVFAFFADAYNLERLTPDWVKFQVLTPRPIAMHEGQLIDYRLRIRGMPMRWRSKITCWEPGVRFVDEQLRGPYAWWRHEHTFAEDGEEVVVGDRVHYGVPLGRLAVGRLINRVLVGPDVRRIFEYRQSQLRSIFDVANIAADHATA